MRRTTLLLCVGVMAMAVLATRAQDSRGESTGSPATAPAPAAPAASAPSAPVSEEPLAPAVPAPSAPDAGTPAPSARLAENQKVTGIVVATPANAIVIRNEAGVEVTFQVASTSLLPRNMRVGDKATIVYRATEHGLPAAVLITLVPAAKPAEPPAPKSAAAADAAVGGPASGQSKAPSTAPRADSVDAASRASQGSGSVDQKLPLPSTSGGEKTANPVAGDVASAVERPPVLPETTSDSTSGPAPPSAAPGADDAAANGASTQPAILWGMSRDMLANVLIGALLLLGIVVGVWFFARRGDQASAMTLRIK